MAEKRVLQQTISTELWNEFKRLRRKGDAEQIAINVGVTAPTVSNVFAHGYVRSLKLQNYMVAFYETRHKLEKEQEKRLKRLV